MSSYPGISQYKSGFGRVSLFQMTYVVPGYPVFLSCFALNDIFEVLEGPVPCGVGSSSLVSLDGRKKKFYV